MITPTEIRNDLEKTGFYGPAPLLSVEEAHAFLRTVLDRQQRPSLDWVKGLACTSRAAYEMGTHPVILKAITAFLGTNVLLWGSSVISQSHGSRHPWHTDIETSTHSGKTVSVWIGLQNVDREPPFAFIPYSHQFGVTVQEARHRVNRRRDDATDEDILGWAQERDPRCRLMKPRIRNGDVLFFEGNLWHATNNLTDGTRWTLLLQYATPETEIRMPDLNQLDWPFRFLPFPKPPCILVSGSDEAGINRIVPPPPGPRDGWSPQLTSRIYPVNTPLPSEETKGWQSYPFFHGSTADLRFFSCHASVLAPGKSPHLPHTHDDEEILMMLSGEADLILPNLQNGTSEELPRKRIKPGELVYYPHDFPHTLETVGTDPANYLMLKWTTNSMESPSPLSHTHCNLLGQQNEKIQEGFHPRLIFEGPTSRLEQLHCHVSTLTPGTMYEPHADAYDVAIVVLEGEVETLGERVTPYGVIFYPAGEPHGMRNPGKVVARYVVFEFHARQKTLTYFAPADAAIPAVRRSLLSKLVDPQCYIRTYRTVAWKIRKMRRQDA